MPSARPERRQFDMRSLLASTGFRIALLNAALMTLTMVLAASAAWVATRDLADRDSRERIAIEARAIRIEATDEGLAAAVDAVVSRAERPGALEYRLVDAAGHRIAGDMAMVTLPTGWTRIGMPGIEPDGDRNKTVLIWTERLAGGGLLSVGDDLARSEATRDAIFRSIAIWGAAAVALGLAISVWLTFGAIARMQAVVHTVAAVGRGDLAARTPVAGRGDDIDTLATGVNAMLDEIGLLVQALRRVSADVAHELRTPLTHVRHRLERIATAPDAAAREAELLAADAAMDQALRLFDTMLRLAEIDGGAVRSRFAGIDLAEIVDRVADAYRPEVEASGRRLLVATAAVPSIIGDPDLIAQALSNLVENCLKYAGDGTVVRIGLLGQNHGVTLIVEDDGPGVETAALPLITQPFYRVDQARVAPGAGIGLAIVAAIARVHGADLEIRNTAQGFAVSLQFPAA